MATPTYDLIDSVTLSSSASSVSLTSIDQSYQDLVLTVDVLGSGGEVQVYLKMNNAASSWDQTWMWGSGSAYGYASESNTQVAPGENANTSNRAVLEATFFDYKDTNKNQAGMIRGSSWVDGRSSLTFWRWNSSNAITSIQIATSSNSYAAGSKFQLFGILG